MADDWGFEPPALAGSELESLPNVQPIAPGSSRYKLELGRAERLAGSRRYAQARTAFEGLRNAAQGDDNELVSLRLAECDYFLKRPRAAREGVKPYIEHASRQAEALFFYAVSVRELGDEPEYIRTVRQLATDFASQSWAVLSRLPERIIRPVGMYATLVTEP